MNRFRLAVVGIDHYHTAGWVGSLEQFPDQVEIVALYDTDPEMGRTLRPSFSDPFLAQQLAERHRQTPFETSLDALIANHRPDIALVTLPNRDAPAAIERLAAAGVHMLVDKPVAKTADEARRAFAAARRAGVTATVGLGKRAAGAWQDAKAMIDAGRLGRLLAAESTFTTSQVKVRDPRNHLFNADRSGHGILHWLGVHDVDALLWLAGEPIVEIQALTANVGRQDIGVEDAVSVAFRYASGAIGTLHFVNAFPRPGGEGYMRFSGENGSIKISGEGTLTWWGPGSRQDPIRLEERRYEVSDWVGYGPHSMVQIQDWLDAIREKRDPMVTGEDLVRALEVIDAAYESAASGRRVAVRRGD
ncbi:MAG: Gfo/Idh/MocA family oxidoreductase, partial [Chloroflexi bacterium]|nr:Gfo/Idh/MocA family oxidoreductase [Chloroflexota bacterium]